jgi:hypothetical protein
MVVSLVAMEWRALHLAMVSVGLKLNFGMLLVKPTAFHVNF